MNALIDLMPAGARKYVYALLSAAVAVFGIWQASQGDWIEFSVALVTTLVALMATANTSPTPIVVVDSAGQTSISDEGDAVTGDDLYYTDPK